jgi:hypothetical protein
MNKQSDVDYVYPRYNIYLSRTKSLILRRNDGKLKILEPEKWFINQYTEVGEDADIYEIKPYGGKRLINRNEIVGQK